MGTVSDVWPNGMPSMGQTARRSRTVTAHDIELFTEMSGDRNPLHSRGEVKVTKVREDKPITEMETRVFLADGTTMLEGTAVCYTMSLG